MDRVKFSLLAHRNIAICNPLSGERIDQLVDALNLAKTARVVDFGAGKCELLIRIIQKYGAACDAVEIAEPFASQSRELGKDRIDPSKLSIHLQEAHLFLSNFSHLLFDASICVGSTHAFGSFKATIEALKKCTRPDGLIVIGKGYWKTTPAKKYLEFLGTKESEQCTHEGNIELAKANGLTHLWSTVASEEDWDQYEGTYAQNIESYASDNPGDPDCQVMLERIRRWRSAYLTWGKSTLGFGLYLFRNTNP